MVRGRAVRSHDRPANVPAGGPAVAPRRCRGDRWRRQRNGARDRLVGLVHAPRAERPDAALRVGHDGGRRPDADHLSVLLNMPILTITIFLPLLGGIALLFVNEARAKRVALTVTLLDLALTLPLWRAFDLTSDRMQFTERVTWITSPPISYAVGLDGISLPLYLMTAFLLPLCVLTSWRSVTLRVKELIVKLLIMETAMLGVFAALDLVLLYVFWEAMLIPMYLIIGVWGGPNRLYAAIKCFLYTLVGSL